jgi:hypothetical protein
MCHYQGYCKYFPFLLPVAIRKYPVVQKENGTGTFAMHFILYRSNLKELRVLLNDTTNIKYLYVLSKYAPRGYP